MVKMMHAEGQGQRLLILEEKHLEARSLQEGEARREEGWGEGGEDSEETIEEVKRGGEERKEWRLQEKRRR